MRRCGWKAGAASEDGGGNPAPTQSDGIRGCSGSLGKCADELRKKSVEDGTFCPADCHGPGIEQRGVNIRSWIKPAQSEPISRKLRVKGRLRTGIEMNDPRLIIENVYLRGVKEDPINLARYDPAALAMTVSKRNSYAGL